MYEREDNEMNDEQWLGGSGWAAWALGAIAWAGVAIALHVVLGRL